MIKRTTTRIESGSNSISYSCDNFKTTTYHIADNPLKCKPVSSIYSFGHWTSVNLDRKQVSSILRQMKKNA